MRICIEDGDTLYRHVRACCRDTPRHRTRLSLRSQRVHDIAERERAVLRYSSCQGRRMWRGGRHNKLDKQVSLIDLLLLGSFLYERFLSTHTTIEEPSSPERSIEASGCSVSDDEGRRRLSSVLEIISGIQVDACTDRLGDFSLFSSLETYRRNWKISLGSTVASRGVRCMYTWLHSLNEPPVISLLVEGMHGFSFPSFLEDTYSQKTDRGEEVELHAKYTRLLPFQQVVTLLHPSYLTQGRRKQRDSTSLSLIPIVSQCIRMWMYMRIVRTSNMRLSFVFFLLSNQTIGLRGAHNHHSKATASCSLSLFISRSLHTCRHEFLYAHPSEAMHDVHRAVDVRVSILIRSYLSAVFLHHSIRVLCVTMLYIISQSMYPIYLSPYLFLICLSIVCLSIYPSLSIVTFVVVLCMCVCVCTACLDYGMYRRQHFSPDHPHIAAFVNVGHSTSSCCIAAFWSDRLRILAEVSDNELGGRDMDYEIMKHFAAEFEKKTHTNPLATLKARLK